MAQANKLPELPTEPTTALETLYRDHAGLADQLADLNRAAPGYGRPALLKLLYWLTSMRSPRPTSQA